MSSRECYFQEQEKQSPGNYAIVLFLLLLGVKISHMVYQDKDLRIEHAKSSIIIKTRWLN